MYNCAKLCTYVCMFVFLWMCVHIYTYVLCIYCILFLTQCNLMNSFESCLLNLGKHFRNSCISPHRDILASLLVAYNLSYRWHITVCKPSLFELTLVFLQYFNTLYTTANKNLGSCYGFLFSKFPEEGLLGQEAKCRYSIIEFSYTVVVMDSFPCHCVCVIMPILVVKHYSFHVSLRM